MLIDVITLGVLLAAVKKAIVPRLPADAEGWSGGRSLGQLDLVTVDGSGHAMRRDAGMAFIAMRAQAQVDGVSLVVDSAYRTWAEQQALYDLYQAGKGNLAAPPGYSNHQGGIAVDVDTKKGTNAAYSWLLQHARSFGFYATVQGEPWHWEYQA